MQDTYLQWVIENTATKWWHDSAEAAELDLGLARGAVGVTTNPFLANLALAKDRQLWAPAIAEVLAQKLPPEPKAEALMRIAVTRTAEKLMPQHLASQGAAGLVCAQVNPLRAGDRDCMLAMASRFHSWAPNIAVKLPATSAGLDVLEDCVAAGITVTATVSFTVPQVVAIAERHRRGIQRARRKRSRARKVLRRDHDRPPGRLPAGSGPRQSSRRSANPTFARQAWQSPSVPTRSTKSAAMKLFCWWRPCAASII